MCKQPAGSAGTTPTSGSGYGSLGNAYQRAGETGCAIQAYEHGIALDPRSAPLQYSLGMSLYAQGKSGAAAEALRRSLEFDPDMASAHLALGAIDHEAGRKTEAVQQWELALQADPTMLMALDWLGKAQIEAGQFATAIALLQHAPETEDLTLDLILADSKAGLFDDAIAVAADRSKSHADWVRLPNAWATVLVQRNRYQEALSVLRAAVAAHPQDESTSLLYLKVLTLTGDSTRRLRWQRHCSGRSQMILTRFI